jgi:WD40 repeat protein
VLRGNQGWVADARFGPGADEVTSVSGDGTVRVWTAEAGRPLASAVGHDGEVWQVALDERGDRFVTASMDHTARVWETADGSPVSTFRGHATEVSSAALAPDGTEAVSGDVAGDVWTWDATTGTAERLIAQGLGSVRRLAYSPDGRRIAAAGDVGVGLWDAATGDPLVQRAAGSSVAAFDPSGDRLLVSVGDLDAAILDSHTGDVLVELAGHGLNILDGQFDATGARAVTASADATARIWDTASGATLLELRAPAEAGVTQSAAFSPDGGRVVTGHDDGMVRVWDAATGALLTSLRGDTAQVRSAVFLPDGRRLLATATSDLAARILACELCATTDELVADARARLTRSLTPDERTRFLHEPVATPPPSETALSASPTASVASTGEPGPSSSAGVSPEPLPSPRPSASVSPAPSADPLGASLCADRRASCELLAGRYHASTFRPPLSFGVEGGWANDYVTPRWVVVSRPDGASALNILSAPDDLLLAGRVIPITSTPEGLLAAVRRPFGLQVGDPVPVEIGGFAGIAFDVINTLDRDIDLLPVDEGTQALAAGQHDRWIAADVNGRTVLVIASVMDGERFEELLPELEAIVESIAFDKRPAPG